jgi:YD repeat-containing protein
MRRRITLGLLLLFVGQSSGMGLAKTAGMSFDDIAQALQHSVASIASPRSFTHPPLVRHTPLPLRPIPDYGDPHRYARLIPRPHGVVIVDRAVHPIDLVELRRTTKAEHHELRVAPIMRSSRVKLHVGPQGAQALSASMTGILPWWTYQARSIPGLGQAMVNVVNLNFLIEENDVDIPAGGLDLAFRRIYNSQSLHDAANHDGSGPSVFGNRWTNNLDVHLGWTAGGQNSGTVSVYTGDGARVDYTCTTNVSQTCTSNTPGVYELLASTDVTNGIACQFQWTKKAGTSYIFNAPYAACALQQGQYGRLLAIDGRNTTFSIQLAYSWSPDASNPENITQIVATHEPDGGELTFNFGQIAGSNPAITELMSVVEPNQEIIDYRYDSTGRLDGVDKPGNNPVLQVHESIPTQWNDGTDIPLGNLPEVYLMQQTGLLEACGPRAAIGIVDNNSPTDGACVDFDYSASQPNQLNDWYTRGVLNPTPLDNVLSPSPIQNGPSGGFVQWNDTAFFSNQDQGTCAPTAVMQDQFLHTTYWCYDTSDRVTQTETWTGGNNWLTTSQTWDANNNLTSTTNARGYATKMGYDANGNTVEVVLPSMTTSLGKISPTSFYDYDNYNNVTYYCDPANNGGNNGWKPPTDSLCQTYGTNHAKFTFDYTDSSEQYGCLTHMVTFLGYDRKVSYANGTGDCGTGPPTDIVATKAISQDDGNSRTPEQTFAYNSAGNLANYSDYPLSGTQWTLLYTSDGMNRLRSRTDPDGVISDSCYNLNGSVFYSETALQHSLDGAPSCPTTGELASGATPPTYAVAYGYDPDGDVVTETRHHNCTTGMNNCEAKGATPAWCTPNVSIAAGTACKYYDGLGRLVEVKQPQAGGDAYKYPWVTRYSYDLDDTQKSFHGTLFQAYGNLYATQELLTTGATTIKEGDPHQSIVNDTYLNMNATAYDPLDRATAKYTLRGTSVDTETLTWDTSPLDGNVGGLLGSDCNMLAQCQQFDYREDGKEMTFKSSDGTSPKRTLVYDPDGRPTTITSAAYSNPQQYSYDADGRIATATDPSGDSIQDRMSPAVVTHNYYADGTLESLDVASAQLTQTGLFKDSYRQDALLETQAVNDGQVSNILHPGTTKLTYAYSSAGRMNERDESGVGANPKATTLQYDSYGQESAYSSPATSLGTFSYSAEGELLSTMIQNTPPTQYWTYSLRGELVGAPSSPYGEVYMANGLMIQTVQNSRTTYSWDQYKAILGGSTPYCVGSNCTPSSGWSYDNAGRMNNQSQPFQYTNIGSPQSATVARTYDAENHLMKTTFSPTPPLQSVEQDVAWGPNGHPVLIGTRDSSGTMHNEVLHWDGNQLLFANNGTSGALDDIKIGAQGDILPKDMSYNDLTFYDRGPGGVVMGCHNATGSSFAGLGDSWMSIFYRGQTSVWHSPCLLNKIGKEPTSIRWFGSAYSGTATSDVGAAMGYGGVLGMPRTDGVTDGFDAIQGVRAFDSTAGSWTTPDAYAGDVNDPGSQKSYLWNGNNPVRYVDPSGYYGESMSPGANAQPIATDYYSGDPSVLQAVPNSTLQAQAKPTSPLQILITAAAESYLGGPLLPSGGITRPGTQTVSQLIENADEYLTKAGVSTKEALVTGLPGLLTAFSNGQTGTMAFSVQLIQITLNNLAGSEITRDYTEVRFQWEHGGYGRLFNGGYPVWRQPFNGIPTWLPVDMQNDVENRNGS